MLSTSENKFRQHRYSLIVILVLVVLLAITAPRLGAVPDFSAGQDSTTLSASDISAHRWQAMANFYSSQAAGIPVTGVNLTALSAADISTYRWQALSMFYLKQALAKVRITPPGR
jgi:hypothetical protein